MEWKCSQHSVTGVWTTGILPPGMYIYSLPSVVSRLLTVRLLLWIVLFVRPVHRLHLSRKTLCRFRSIFRAELSAFSTYFVYCGFPRLRHRFTVAVGCFNAYWECYNVAATFRCFVAGFSTQSCSAIVCTCASNFSSLPAFRLFTTELSQSCHTAASSRVVVFRCWAFELYHSSFFLAFGHASSRSSCKYGASSTIQPVGCRVRHIYYLTSIRSPVPVILFVGLVCPVVSIQPLRGICIGLFPLPFFPPFSFGLAFRRCFRNW